VGLARAFQPDPSGNAARSAQSTTGASLDFRVDASACGLAKRWARCRGVATRSCAPTSLCDGGLGGHVRHVIEFAAGRSVGWRSHRFFYCAMGAQICVPTDYSHSIADELLPVAGMVHLGSLAAVEQLPASSGCRVAASLRRACVVGSLCPGHVGTHLYACTDHALVDAGGDPAASPAVGEQISVIVPRRA
jgi:hypothetical protein